MRNKIGECLIRSGLISEPDLEAALAEQERTGERLGAVLARMNLASEQAIAKGVSLTWILDELARRDFELAAPVLLMSYLNPLLAFGYEALARRAAEVGVAGFIVPDLLYEERAPLYQQTAHFTVDTGRGRVHGVIDGLLARLGGGGRAAGVGGAR